MFWTSPGRLILVIAGVALLVAGGAAVAASIFLDSLPTAVTVNVHDGQKDVPLDQALVFSTSRPVALGAFQAALSITPGVAGTLAGSPGQTSFSWTPSRRWAEMTEYRVHLVPFRDTTGHQVSERTWHFTTTLVPQVTSLTTRTGTLVTDRGQVPLGAALRLTFNTSMDTSTVRLLANGSPLGLTWGLDARSADVDVSSLRTGSVSFTIAPGARDADGRPLADWRLDATVVSALS